VRSVTQLFQKLKQGCCKRVFEGLYYPDRSDHSLVDYSERNLLRFRSKLRLQTAIPVLFCVKTPTTKYSTQPNDNFFIVQFDCTLTVPPSPAFSPGSASINTLSILYPLPEGKWTRKSFSAAEAFCPINFPSIQTSALPIRL